MTQAPAPPLPEGIHRAADYERLAAERLPAPVFAYLRGGSGEDWTATANRQAFAGYAIVPRCLATAMVGSTAIHLGGLELASPVGLAPVAHQGLVHAEAELATARGAAVDGGLMVVSGLSNRPLEAIAAQAPTARWFQLYLQPRREVTLDLLHRAERAGYQAVVLTVDAAIQLPSQQALAAGFRLPPDCQAANLAGYDPQHVVVGNASLAALVGQAPDWAALEWLMAHSPLPVWVKGVLHPEDARRLMQRGVAGIVVSNHGGRTVDGVVPSLAMLPALRTAVGVDYPLLFDGGIRSGADVFKALALGADAVLVGRLQLYALAAAGALGVAHLLRLLREELLACMALGGCATLADVRQATLWSAAPGRS
jgi:isopentenyl diphosphate isomerase/L-lactate dehydrogenase-like FMN-dependent dehydrogenase